ncbi:hypothetical protein FOXYSP1_08321 [Fusarium oxysporum f. sp. phaseoli]
MLSVSARPVNQPSGQQHHDQSPASLLVTRNSTENPIASSSLPADQTATNPVVPSFTAQYDHDSGLPLIAPGESTTLFQVACEIIAQKRMAGMDMSDVE